MSLTGLILAAGKGKRMQSDLPKVLHEVAGKPMLEWVLKALNDVPCDFLCVVLGENYSPFLPLVERFSDLAVCLQKNVNGTAGAVASVSHLFRTIKAPPFGHGELLRGVPRDPGYLLICAGDTPALDPKLLADFVTKCRQHSARLGVLGMRVPNPTGYGRLLVSSEGYLERIVEEKDADAKTKEIRICNSGILFAETKYLFELLAQIENKNLQNEYYLTDCVQIATNRGDRPQLYITEDWQTLLGVNDQEQLASLDSILKTRSLLTKD